MRNSSHHKCEMCIKKCLYAIKSAPWRVGFKFLQFVCELQLSVVHPLWLWASENKRWIEIQECVKQKFSSHLTFKMSHRMGWRITFSWEINFQTKTEAPALQTWKELMSCELTAEQIMSNDGNKTKQFKEIWKSIYEPQRELL